MLGGVRLHDIVHTHAVCCMANQGGGGVGHKWAGGALINKVSVCKVMILTRAQKSLAQKECLVKAKGT